MVFIADDLAAWLVGLLADEGRRRLITFVVGSDLQRALESAATAAIERAAAELNPVGGEGAEALAMVISQVFTAPPSDLSLAEYATLLQALQAAIVSQLAPLGDAQLTGTGRSSMEVLGVSLSALTDKLIAYLVQEIVIRGARGGPLTPLASQLEHDRGYLQGQRIEGMAVRLTDALATLNLPQSTLFEPRLLFRHLVESHTQLFAGRRNETAAILDFVGSHRTGYVFVEALSGYGKTSLLAHLVETHPEFHYHFISQDYKRSGPGFDPTRRGDLLRSLCEQLNPGYRTIGGVDNLETEFIRLLSTAPQNQTVIVLDAIDEVDKHPSFLRGLLPWRLPDGYILILSARSQGDRCYLPEVGLSLDRIALHLPLPGLDGAAITELLKLAGGSAYDLADGPGFVSSLCSVSGGDPFYLRFLVEDIANGILTSRNIQVAPSGLAPYLDMQLAQLDRAAYRAQHRDILGLILEAGQPLGHEDLIAMVDGLDWLNFDNVLRDIHRFLLVHQDQYTFCHDRFREYFLEKHM